MGAPKPLSKTMGVTLEIVGRWLNPEVPGGWQQGISDREGVPRSSSPLGGSPPLTSVSVQAAVKHIRCCVGGTGFSELEECLASLAAETPFSGEAPHGPNLAAQLSPSESFKTILHSPLSGLVCGHEWHHLD